MTELVVSDITRMGTGFCVIGIEHGIWPFRSIRPRPQGALAWPAFTHQRGDRLLMDLSEIAVEAPHIEDRRAGTPRKVGSITESQVVACLKESETATTLRGLFGCQPRHRSGEALYVEPAEAQRSICGCPVKNISFHFPFSVFRAALALPSGESLPSLPVVDRDWNVFLEGLAPGSPAHVAPARLERFFNSFVRERVLAAGIRFARIGIIRPRQGCCWLMLDSLFPLPDPAWVDVFHEPGRPWQERRAHGRH